MPPLPKSQDLFDCRAPSDDITLPDFAPVPTRFFLKLNLDGLLGVRLTRLAARKRMTVEELLAELVDSLDTYFGISLEEAAVLDQQAAKLKIEDRRKFIRYVVRSYARTVYQGHSPTRSGEERTPHMPVGRR